MFPSSPKLLFYLYNFWGYLREYDDFFTSKKCFSSHGGHFWNAVSKTVEALEDNTSKIVAVLWNNIVKIGKSGDKGRPQGKSMSVHFLIW